MRDSPSLVDALERAARSDRGVIFVDGAGDALRLSYSEVHLRAKRTAAALIERGTRPGDRVGIILRTSPEFYDAFFGTLLSGAVPVPLYPPFRLGEVAEYDARTAGMLRSAGCRLVVTDAASASLLRGVMDLAAPELGCSSIATLANSGLAERRASDDDAALVQFSSGSTREPKGAVLTHRQILSNVGAIRDLILSAHPESADLRHVAACWLPLYHDMGLIGCVITALVHPADLVLIPPEVFIAAPIRWLEAISKYRVTVSPAPNFAFAYCAERISEAEAAPLDLSSWRVAMNGAEAVTADPIRRFCERFAGRGFRPEAMTPVYGLSEASLIVAASPLRRPCRFERFDREALEVEGRAIPARSGDEGAPLCSVGKTIAGFELRIVGEDGSPLAPGRVGRVHINGPSLLREYVGGGPRHPRDPEGWLDTADLGFLHDGELFIYGRADDVVIVRGRKYAPDRFEQAAVASRAVRAGRCVAFGVASPDHGTERVVVVVERPRREPRLDDDAIAERVRRAVSEVTGIRPADVLVVEPGALPRTSNGKLRRGSARTAYVKSRMGGFAHGET